jgi:hypothetical protein
MPGQVRQKQFPFVLQAKPDVSGAARLLWILRMNKQANILLIGSKAFADKVTTLLALCKNVRIRHTSRVTIQLFLAKRRLDCAIVNCDDLGREALAEIETLNRLEPKITVVLISSHCISRLAAAAAATILSPSEMYSGLVPLLRSLLNENVYCSA